MRRRFLVKICVLFAVVFVLCQSLLLPMVLATGAWTGNAWLGNSWNGEAWEGETWEGEKWQGDSWTSEASDSKQSPNNSGINDPVLGSELLPPYANNPYLPYRPSLGNGNNHLFNDSLLPPSGSKENVAKDNSGEQEIDPWDVASYIGNDVINGQVDFAVGILEQGDNVDLKSTFGGPNFFSSLILNGAKLPLGDRTPPWFDLVEDVHSGAGMAYDLYDGYSGISSAAGTVGDVVRSGTEMLPNVVNVARPVSGALTKFNIATSAVSTGFSLVNTINSAGDTWDVINSEAAITDKVSAGATTASDFGELVFNVGMTTAAFPGAQAAGLAIAVAGGAIWLAGKGVKWAANNWSSISESTVGKAAKSAWKGITKPFKWLTGS